MSIALCIAGACGESTAPSRGSVPVVLHPNTPDVSGNYALQSLQGVRLPARFPGLFAPRDSVYGGCLAFGKGYEGTITHGDTTSSSVTGSANENIFHTSGGADSAAANPAYCPAYTSMTDGGSRYTISGDSGWVYICGKTTCDSTLFVVTGSGASRVVTVGNSTLNDVFLSR